MALKLHCNCNNHISDGFARMTYSIIVIITLVVRLSEHLIWCISQPSALQRWRNPVCLETSCTLSSGIHLSPPAYPNVELSHHPLLRKWGAQRSSSFHALQDQTSLRCIFWHPKTYIDHVLQHASRCSWTHQHRKYHRVDVSIEHS